jgi:hypothetical protein
LFARTQVIAARRAIELIQYKICVGQKNRPPVLSLKPVVAKLVFIGLSPIQPLECSDQLPAGRSNKVCGQAIERSNER